jgi:hypothetical protein
MKSLYNSVIKNYKLLIILVIFVLGIYYYANSYQVLENMENKESECPNMLIEKDGEIYLFNSKKPLKDNENPIKFDNLEDYAKFVKLQKDNNIECAALVLQYTTDTQNNDLIQIKSSIFENDGGISPMTKDMVKDTEKKKEDEYYERNKIFDATLDSTPNSDIKFNTNAPITTARNGLPESFVTRPTKVNGGYQLDLNYNLNLDSIFGFGQDIMLGFNINNALDWEPDALPIPGGLESRLYDPFGRTLSVSLDFNL